jgi:hypothetical protein
MKPLSQSEPQELQCIRVNESTEGLPMEIVLEMEFFLSFPLKFLLSFHQFENKQGKLREKFRVANNFRDDLFNLLLLGCKNAREYCGPNIVV